ncbi:PEP-CTERM sorting domain-containing protein [Oxalobacteraceae sp. CFBP 13730]|nr:PEP-CTERM sorting domain-containing protein [Oxalobacteraceae sp. CFBP 13730]
MKLIKSLRNVALAAMLFSAGVANAALYQFQLTGDYTASWQLDSTVSPDAFGDDEGFILIDVEGNFPGSLFDFADLSFYSEAIGGGMEILDYYGDNLLLSTDGFQLYTGSEESPTFRLGTFALTEYLGAGRYTLTVTDLDAPPPPVDVPEPASAALLLGGLGVLLASRKRRQAK